MRVLITRPEEDAATLVAELARLGVAAEVAPLLRIKFKDGAALDLEGAQALLLTSANGARALARRTDERGLKVLAVGASTAAQARDLGFTDVTSADGDVDDLARLAAATLDPAGGTLIHAAGSKTAGDLAGMLAAAGFEYRREVLYRAETADVLPDVARAGLTAERYGGVLIYSPRTGATFARLVEDAGLAPNLAAVTVYCLSANVAAKVRGLPWAAVRTAARPDQAAMLEMFGEK
ncbi:MAG: uroporphyrinogen-III synthase [Rhodospirillaceae bacterium]